VDGYGEAEEFNGKIIFKSTSGLRFNNNVILRKVVCDQ
jgi:hypothetical protein